MKASDAWPLALVVPMMVLLLLLNAPLAPLEGAVNVTDAPAIGLPKASSTVAVRTLKAALTMTLCAAPEVAAMLVAAPRSWSG